MVFTNFTSQERMVLLFLGVTLLAGGVVRWTKIQQSPVLQIQTASVYEEMSTFQAVSHELNSNAASTEPTSGEKLATDGNININQADAATLQQLSGIGPTLASRIVDFRSEHGPFTQIEDLMKVKGIGTKMFEKNSQIISAE
ncbi:MAG: helix-hairpin-helix domain-containing protein [Candidatus Marinimicrobia bacterium]|nr:helix-hairpin-helix domain-containing protein [Candidatus Neomarinimicrobiota bacterium]MCF7839187.1 helix-hairpin-helix domain-containing protein [Candidatus Neomarinimicrobiota bacterium]MCF7902368.1 helix-hairpin-helix domain-containing protein [Candidatus Neomarinimicrobiota bacterium]